MKSKLPKAQLGWIAKAAKATIKAEKTAAKVAKVNAKTADKINRLKAKSIMYAEKKTGKAIPKDLETMRHIYNIEGNRLAAKGAGTIGGIGVGGYAALKAGKKADNARINKENVAANKKKVADNKKKVQANAAKYKKK